MAFKNKTKGKLIVDDRQTLDAKHNNILQSFTEQKDHLLELHNELDTINEKINNLSIENNKSQFMNMTLQTELWKYEDQKKELETEITNIETNTTENSYMLKTAKLLSNYYKIINEEKKIASGKIDNANVIIVNSNDEMNIKKKSIIDWFQPANHPATLYENIDTGKKTIHMIKKKNIGNFKDEAEEYKKKQKAKIILQNKDTIYDKYMKLIDKNYINTAADNSDMADFCSKCLVEMLLNNNTGQLICPKCGLMENIIVDSDKPSFKEPPKEMTSFCYKRINHLNEFLAQFQAKETTDIPEDVYNEILLEIKKERINNMANITPEKMRILLKKIKKNDYYEHIPYIINQLNGLPAPVISPEVEEIIRGMFKAIQIPFEKYCPQQRKNFLSYNYVMYKFFELLELDEYLNCFQLLKSRTKLHQQDEIWKNICKDLNWEFIKSL
jgi:hypothetical protein